MNYETVIGLEIHAELSTKTKAFCSCEYKFGGEVNTQCCPGCMGMPGTLPVLNKNVVEYALRMGLATDCEINKISKHDRKNYFYPDLAKGYQITQADIPICENGRVEFYHKGEKRIVRLTRIHIEEDTAKLLHDDSFKGTLLDFNRSGVPLIEIVSEPDLRSAEEAKDYLEAVRMLLMALNICNGQMQEGTIRCDVNVSVRPVGEKKFGTRVEMKNVNTFSGAMLAIEYESNRQINLLRAGKNFSQETRRWDENKNASVTMRTKEDAADYRYFHDTDLTPIVIDDEWLAEIKNSLPELPVAKFDRYRSMGISEAESWLLAENSDKAEFFEKCTRVGNFPAKTIAHWIFGAITARLNKSFVTIEKSPLTAENFCEILSMIEKGILNNDTGKIVLDEMFTNGGSPDEIVQKLSLVQVSDEEELKKLVEEVLKNNTQSIADYKNGKKNAFTFLVGQCMKASKGKANPQIINKLINELM
ncbi:MAG: Asp-tRNA(Asn)/Glu-tRNA(Gln) amidotransferase subunit GatB [Clostridiales bacterium]|jgi:aspartyl-tRNA(Asn)/glutamyl-tRNA(Gln) amidotransferase subunit B|nr:Asp-tRNA(Asn)/Glu-tRNA(Gln) amidotransferase subunit GatB [Clostridiales bacterium]